MTSAKTVRATFELAEYPLTLSYGGLGSGTVEGVAWSSCSATGCTATVLHGTAVTLQPEHGSVDLFIPAAAVLEARKVIEPIFKGAQ